MSAARAGPVLATMSMATIPSVTHRVDDLRSPMVFVLLCANLRSLMVPVLLSSRSATSYVSLVAERALANRLSLGARLARPCEVVLISAHFWRMSRLRSEERRVGKEWR